MVILYKLKMVHIVNQTKLLINTLAQCGVVLDHLLGLVDNVD